MMTATVGAVCNIVLNLLLIPGYGAQGAAIATAISYFVVYGIRAVDTKKYLAFDMCIVRVSVNTLLVIAQAVIMIAELPYWQIWQIAIILVLTLINVKDIIKAMTQLLRKFLKNN